MNKHKLPFALTVEAMVTSHTPQITLKCIKYEGRECNIDVNFTVTYP